MKHVILESGRVLPSAPSCEGEAPCPLRSEMPGCGAPRAGGRSHAIAMVIGMAALALAACSSQPRRSAIDRAAAGETAARTASVVVPAPVARPTSSSKRGGGYYLDDGPGDGTPTPEALAAIPDAVPKAEPLNRFTNKPYTVFNREYVPLTSVGTYKARGVGSWYGRKFHGQRTSNGEVYDMFGMTAAHPTLPLPSYARVTNPANGRAVVVRVNDRGPFHAGRIIDLSYVAAWKLGYVGNGSTLLEVESLLPGSAEPVVGAPELARSDPLGDLIQRVDSAVLPPGKPGEAVLPEVKEARGVFLQLGAFGNPENAESFKSRLGRELSGLARPEEGPDLSGKLSVLARAGLYRVQLGPWPDRESAQRAAERLRAWFDIQPLVVHQ